MVQEIRKIILADDELVAALESFKRTNPAFLPSGRVVRCTQKTADSIQIDMEHSEGNTVKAITITRTHAELVGCLIKFCLENNIMLPRVGQKSACLEGERIALSIFMDYAVELPL